LQLPAGNKNLPAALPRDHCLGNYVRFFVFLQKSHLLRQSRTKLFPTMKQIILFFSLLLLATGFMKAQPVKGFVYKDTMGIQVVKIWGTHQERGYALGYLTGAKITDMIVNYLKPQFGAYYNTAKSTLVQGADIVIRQVFTEEAQGVIDGMDAAGTNTGNLDKYDILLGSSFLDIENIMSKMDGPGCSSLMSWNDATAGTGLNGKSVVSRHMDWNFSNILIKHNTMVVHFPSEPGESKWMMVGFSGMMGALSGISPEFGTFQHVISDYSGSGMHNKQYTPIWFALRQALEAADYNNDGERNVQDVRAVLDSCQNGFAAGFIVCSMAKSNPVDSLVALVAELTPTTPTHSYRGNSYPDSIPGDNLYAANEQIVRNNAMNMSARYNSIRTHIGDGTGISLSGNWELMRDYSHQSNNMQFMEYAPEADFFQLAIYRDNKFPYLNTPTVFSLAELFSDPTVSVRGHIAGTSLAVFPNPASRVVHFAGIATGCYSVDIYDLNGRQVMNLEQILPGNGIDVSSLSRGLYFFRIFDDTNVYAGRFSKN